MTSRAQSWTRNVGGGVLPQPSNNIDTTLSELQVWSSNSSQNKVSAKPIATRLGFVVLHCSRSGGPDTVPSTAYEQQLETPMKIKHILRGRFWTQLRIQNSACRRFTMPPSAFGGIEPHLILPSSIVSFSHINIHQPCRSQPQDSRRRRFPALQGGNIPQNMSREVIRISL